MKILHNRVLVKPIKDDVKVKGIIVPNQKKYEAEVLLIGEKVKTVSVGDIVKYVKNTGVGINYLDQECILLSESNDIIAIL